MIEEFVRHPLGEICRVINGRAYKQTELLDKGVYRVLRVGNFFSNNSWYYSDLELEEDKYCDYGDLLFAWSASFGPRIWTEEKVIYHYHIWKMVPNEKIIDKTYLFYLLKNKTLSFMKSTHGSIMLHLTKGFMEELNLDLPESIEKQREIAKVLSDLDAKIELNNKINNELEAMAKLIYDYWFVQFDFPDENGKPYKSSGGIMVYNEELKREIPEGWEVKDIQDLGTCIMGQSPKSESYNQEGIGTPLLNGPADYENGSLRGRTFTTQPTRLCKRGDLVLCIRASIGNLVYSEKEFCLGRGVAAVRPISVESSEYIYYLLEREIEVFKVRATGSIIKGITKDDLTLAKVPVPGYEKLKAFSNIVKPKFDKIRLNKKENLKLAELRDWLLPMLMNGQVTVN